MTILELYGVCRASTSITVRFEDQSTIDFDGEYDDLARKPWSGLEVGAIDVLGKDRLEVLAY